MIPGQADDPVLIGAVGGSGTRIFSKLLREAGIYMGTDVCKHEDAQAVSRVHNRFLLDYVAAKGHLADEAEASDAAFAEMATHLKDIPRPGDAWGAKEPRTMLMLPFWHQRFPKLRFIHVIRNGLDMAYSRNQNQPSKYGDHVVAEVKSEGPRSPVRSILYWQEANRRVAEYGERELGDRYIRIRHEDLWNDPERTVTRLYDFVGVHDPDRLRAGVELVSRPERSGRWRERSIRDIARIVHLGGEGLERFGYWNSDLARSFEEIERSTRWRPWQSRRANRPELQRLPTM